MQLNGWSLRMLQTFGVEASAKKRLGMTPQHHCAVFAVGSFEPAYGNRTGRARRTKNSLLAASYGKLLMSAMVRRPMI